MSPANCDIVHRQFESVRRQLPMKTLITIILLSALPLSFASGQAKSKKTAKQKPGTIQSKPTPVAAKPTQVTSVTLLSKQEQALLDEINLARSNPAAYIAFLQQYRSYYQGKSVVFPDGYSLVTNEGTAALDDAIAYLRTLKPAPAFQVRKGMVLGAKIHLDDMLKTGRDGHIGSDGSKPEDRITRFGAWQDSVGEDIVYDSRTPRYDVIGLIIDDGVATRGHRKNLFKTNFKVIGISIGQPVSDRARCVITFAGDFFDRDSKTATQY